MCDGRCVPPSEKALWIGRLGQLSGSSLEQRRGDGRQEDARSAWGKEREGSAASTIYAQRRLGPPPPAAAPPVASRAGAAPRGRPAGPYNSSLLPLRLPARASSRPCSFLVPVTGSVSFCPRSPTCCDQRGSDCFDCGPQPVATKFSMCRIIRSTPVHHDAWAGEASPSAP